MTAADRTPPPTCNFTAFCEASATMTERFASTRHDYCWHLEIVPRLNAIAGFEIGLGAYINPVFPEEAARFLRGEGRP